MTVLTCHVLSSANPVMMRMQILERGWWICWRRSTQMVMMKWSALSTRPGQTHRRKKPEEMNLTSESVFWLPLNYISSPTCHSCIIAFLFNTLLLTNILIRTQVYTFVLLSAVISPNVSEKYCLKMSVPITWHGLHFMIGVSRLHLLIMENKMLTKRITFSCLQWLFTLEHKCNLKAGYLFASQVKCQAGLLSLWGLTFLAMHLSFIVCVLINICGYIKNNYILSIDCWKYFWCRLSVSLTLKDFFHFSNNTRVYAWMVKE